MVGTVVWVLLGVFIANGQPNIGVNIYQTEKSCQVDAAKAVNDLVAQHQNTGSVQCVKVVLGSFA